MFAVRLIYFLACVFNTVAMMSACLMLVFVVLLPAATYVGRYHIMVIIILGAAMLGEYHQTACSYTDKKEKKIFLIYKEIIMYKEIKRDRVQSHI